MPSNLSSDQVINPIKEALGERDDLVKKLEELENKISQQEELHKEKSKELTAQIREREAEVTAAKNKSEEGIHNLSIWTSSLTCTR